MLPEAFTADLDRLARFEREATVLASLNHPNIGSIYGLEEAEGVGAVVLELVGFMGVPLPANMVAAKIIREESHADTESCQMGARRSAVGDPSSAP